MTRLPIAALFLLLSGADAKDPDSAYAALVRGLPEARKAGKVDSLFVRFLDNLRIAGHKEENAASPLVKRWVADAAQENHEETRLWYSLGMNTVRGLGFGGVTLSHFKIRPGEEADITWHDPTGDTPAPKNTTVELALREKAGTGVRYRTLETGTLRKDSVSAFWRRKLDRPGIYRITVLAEGYFQQAYVQVGNLDLVIKEDGDRFLVWGTSPGNTLKPPYRVHATGPGGWVLDTLTDDRGLASLRIPKQAAFRKAMQVVLEKDGHSAYGAGAVRSDPSRSPVIWLFTDRPRYRPGDRVHFRGVVKTMVGDQGLEDGWKGRMQVTPFNPGGNSLDKRYVEVDAWGNFADSMDIPADAGLGHWRVEAHRPDTAKEKSGSWASRSAAFEVEEYRKPDFRIEAEPRWIGDKGKVSLRIRVRYPDGSPVGNVPAKVKWFRGRPTWEPDAFFGNGGPSYRYMDLDYYDYGRSNKVLRQDSVKLDAHGSADLIVDPPDAAALGWSAEIEVRNGAGRTVRETAKVRKTTNDLGIRIESDKFRYEEGDLAKFRVTAREPDGSPRKGKVRLNFKKDDRPVFDTSLAFDADGRAYLVKTLESTGKWMVLADLDPDRPESPVSEVSFLVVNTITSGQEPPIVIELLPRETGRPDSVRFRLKGGWGASLLLATLEGPTLGAFRVLPPGEGTRLFASLPLPKGAAYRVRVMVAFSGARGWEADSVVLDLPDSAHVLRAAVEAPESWKPGERFRGRIRVTDAKGRPAKVRFSLGVTDEATHQGVREYQDPVTVLVPSRSQNQVRSGFGEKSEEHLWATAGAARHPEGAWRRMTEFEYGWDPFDSEYYRNSNYRKKRERKSGASILFGRALPVSGWLDNANAVYIMGNAGEKGFGDGEGDMPIRREFRDRAYWAPMVSTDASGRAEVDFPWPDDIARWRLTARGAGPGSALLDYRDTLFTRLDFSVRLAAPRTFTVGDSALLTALVTNAAGRTLRGEVAFASVDTTVAGVLGPGSRASDFPPGVTPMRFPVRILKMGRAEFRVSLRTAEAGVDGDAEVRSYPVIETGSRVVTAGAGQATPVAGGKVEPFSFRLDSGYRPGSAKVELEAFSVPVLALVGPVENLLEYPYGCAEQTLSRFVPMLQVLETLRRLGIRREELEGRMQGIADSGLKRLEALQVVKGGWGWWQAKESNPYITTLVVEGLHRAAEADLPPELRSRAARLRDNGLAILRKGFNATTLDPQNAAEIASVLSMMGPRGEWEGPMERAWQERNKASLRTLALLLSLSCKAGKPDREQEILKLIREQVRIPDRRISLKPYFHELEIRGLTSLMLALLETGHEPETMARIASWLHHIRQGEGWGSTRNTAMVLEALARHAEAMPRGPVDGWLKVDLNGTRIQADTVRTGKDGSVYLRWTLAGPAVDSALRIGENALAVVHEGRGFLHHSVRVGLNTSTPPTASAKGRRLGLKRSYQKVWYVTGADGAPERKTGPLGGHALRPGEEVDVTLDLESPEGGSYVMIEDPIPGGMEYQPPGLERTGWYGYYSSHGFDHLEARDDRVAFFATHLAAGRKQFHYTLRAETRGRFVARSARAELMYEPEINAESKATVLSIRP